MPTTLKQRAITLVRLSGVESQLRSSILRTRRDHRTNIGSPDTNYLRHVAYPIATARGDPNFRVTPEVISFLGYDHINLALL